MVVLVGYGTVKEALVDQAEHFTGRAPIPFLIKVLRGYGLAISNGDRWRQLRRFTLTTLRDFGMGRKRMEQWIQEESRHLLESFEETKCERREEIDQVIGQNRIPTMDDRKSLPFTDAVIHEVQRYLDIVPLNVPHYATRDISFRGYIIPKVRMNTYSGQLLLSWRLLDYIVVQWQLLQNAPKYFLIISCKRSCVGESLARMELFLFIVSLLQKFSFSSPKGPDGVDTSPELSSFGNMPRFYDLIASPR
uniref:Cytochrome P450 2G1-like n=1 Tax=Sinocyclocheilus rhinocerous TaxID=307959 RepID=A0A673K1L4_9TELE